MGYKIHKLYYNTYSEKSRLVICILIIILV